MKTYRISKKVGAYETSTAPSLDTKCGSSVMTNQGGAAVLENNYTLRRLTPTETARLQGFPDGWCEDLKQDDFDFWRQVFDTDSEIKGKSRKSDNAIRKFMNNPYSESAEYRMWGNGVALPCVWFIMEGIKWWEENRND